MSVVVDGDRCSGCARCVEVCPGDLLCLSEKGNVEVRDPRDCWDCMACVKACPHAALQTRLPYALADYKASLVPCVGEDNIVWTCTDAFGCIESFTVRTRSFV